MERPIAQLSLGSIIAKTNYVPSQFGCSVIMHQDEENDGGEGLQRKLEIRNRRRAQNRIAQRNLRMFDNQN
jgi:hypothetical protein